MTIRINRDRLKAILKRHEGERRDARGRHVLYDDATGRPIPLQHNVTVGWGCNLSDGLTDAHAEALLDVSLDQALADCRRTIPRCDHLDAVRQEAFADMMFNLGKPRLAGFVKMLGATANGDWVEVGREALDSNWARQVGTRAHQIAEALTWGQWPEE